MMDELRSSETSVLTKGKRSNIPENGILQLVSTLQAQSAEANCTSGSQDYSEL
jgi:hypothetical protein